ncbi:MAG: multidrug efflux pump subunit AcrA (membrane-fusion protein) [Myxococcota bacterium]
MFFMKTEFLMNSVKRPAMVLALLTAALALTSCGHPDHPPAPAPPAAEPEGPIERLDVPAPVRSNLGIRFVTAELRAVERIVRLPGRFAPDPAAVHVYPAPLAGPVRPAVRLHERVTTGQLLATIDSPELRRRQLELHEAEHTIARAVSARKLVRARLKSVKKRLVHTRRRMKRLQSLSGKSADIDALRVELEAERDVLEAESVAGGAEIERERHHHHVLIEALSAVAGVSAESLDAEGGKGTDTEGPAWSRLTALEIRATADGVVTTLPLARGAWADRGAALLEVTDPARLRFVATALEGDIGRLEPGLPGRISTTAGEASGPITIGVRSDTTARTFPVVVYPSAISNKMRAGLTGFLDVTVAGAGIEEIAVPMSAVVRAGLKQVVFRRNPSNPDEVIRAEVDTGPDDGKWVAVYSGVNLNDEIVDAGAYELQLATSAGPKKPVGHVHADGSVHEAH